MKYSVARVNSRHLFVAGIVLIGLVGVLVAVYLTAGLRASGGSTPIMPLDDTYIHFQYARAIADGYPFRYNPDQPPTSGATSLLYPALLAVGYRIGFQGERLAWWALAIGVLCWIGSAWLVYRIGAKANHPESHEIGLIVAVAFVLTGSLGWAFMSGMETGLMVLVTLLTLWYAVREDRRGVILAGTLAALVRPEGLAIGLLAALYLAIREPSWRTAIRHAPGYLLPLIAGLVQPILNVLVTGSATASGMQAKSYLYNVPADAGTMIRAMADVIARVWIELVGGLGEKGVPYVLPGLVLFCAAVGIIGLRTSPPTPLSPSERGGIRRIGPPILIVGWLLALTAAVSILETAFWQFKRYQQPMIALLFPLAAWSLIRVWCMVQPRFRWITVGAVLIILVGFSLVTSIDFVGYYADNVREVASSQVPMAHYVADHVPPGAVVGVHDIGVMRYLGDHPTYDVIGLTTPGAARAWRSGPGSAYEQMLRSPWRPDYFAIYHDARGLDYFAQTDLYKDTLAQFPSTQPVLNIASATNGGQAVYKADWTYAASAGLPWQPSSLTAVAGMRLVDSVNAADLSSEDAHRYRWWQAANPPGFPTEVREMDYISCANPPCKVMDGGRLITGGDEMTITTEPGKDLLWIMRVHPYNAVRLSISVDDKPIAHRVIPSIPGQWLEIATLIPGSAISGTQTRVRAEANLTDPAAGFYMPYYHWFYQGTYHADSTVTLPGPGARFDQAIVLDGSRVIYDPARRTVTVDLEWHLDPAVDSASLGNAKTFVHLYDQSDHLASDGQKDIQIDQWPGNGTLPPANWLPGVLRDSYTLKVPAAVPPGTYRVAIGLYDPATGIRLPVTGEGAGSDRRLFVGMVDIR